MKARPAFTTVIVLMLMSVALMIPARALCAPVLGYFGKGITSNGCETTVHTTMAAAGGACQRRRRHI